MSNLEQAEYYSDSLIDAYDNLDKCIQHINKLNDLSLSDEFLWRNAEDRSYQAIHDFCTSAGIGIDEEGLFKRKKLALEIDKSIRFGHNPFESQTADSILAFLNSDNPIEDVVEVSSDYLDRFESSVKPRNGLFDETPAGSLADNYRGQSTTYYNLQDVSIDPENNPLEYSNKQRNPFKRIFNLFSARGASQPSIEQKQQKRNGLIAKGIAVVALAGVVFYGVGRCTADDETKIANSYKGNQSTNTILNPSNTTEQTNTTLQASNTVVTVPSSTVENVPAPSFQPLPPADVVVTPEAQQVWLVKKGDSLWRLLQENFAYLNLEKNELNNRIAKVVSILANDNELSNPDLIYSDQKIVVNQKAIETMIGNK